MGGNLFFNTVLIPDHCKNIHCILCVWLFAAMCVCAFLYEGKA